MSGDRLLSANVGAVRRRVRSVAEGSLAYLVAFIVVLVEGNLLALASWTASLQQMPMVTGALLLGFLLPRRGWLHGLILGGLVAFLVLYVLILITYLNTGGAMVFFPPGPWPLVRQAATDVVVGSLGGYAGSWLRGRFDSSGPRSDNRKSCISS